MALSKDKKQQVVQEVSDLLSSSKMTVVAKYQGTTVKALQGLRKDARNNGTRVKVIKNRLVIQALKNDDKYKEVDASPLQGMLLYAFNGDDEVAAAQVLKTFAKANPSVEFVGAISEDGKFLDANSVKQLADLPGKEQLLSGVVSLLNSPIRNTISSISGDLHTMLKGLEAKAS